MSICQGCHAGCCRSFAVPITGADMLRLERETGQSFWEFGCRWADPQGAIAARYAPHFHFQDEPETPFAICLKQETSSLFPGSGKCRFLNESPASESAPFGVGSCGIYQGRPAACRVFPTKFDVSSDLPIIHHVPEYGRAEKLPQYKLCSRQWEPGDIDAVEAAQELVVARYEMRFFHQIAALWNRQAGPWDIFPDFIREVYQRRVKSLPAEVATIEADQEEEARHLLKMPVQSQQKRGAA